MVVQTPLNFPEVARTLPPDIVMLALAKVAIMATSVPFGRPSAVTWPTHGRI